MTIVKTILGLLLAALVIGVIVATIQIIYVIGVVVVVLTVAFVIAATVTESISDWWRRKKRPVSMRR